MRKPNKNINLCSTCPVNARCEVCWWCTNPTHLLPAASPAGDRLSSLRFQQRLSNLKFGGRHIYCSLLLCPFPFLSGEGSFWFTGVEVGCPFPDGSKEQTPIWLMQMPLFWLYPGGHPANPVVPNYLRGLWNTRWFYIPYVLENISMKMLRLNDVATSAQNLPCFMA